MAIIDNLISYYKLDGTSGDVVDSHGTNDGTNVGATRGVTGKIGNAFSFDGINDNVLITTMGNFGSNLGNGISLSFWINTTESEFKSFFGTREAGITGVVVNANDGGDGKLAFYLRDDDGNILWFRNTNDVNFNDGEWHHIVFTANGSSNSGKIYVDGTSKDVTNVTQTTPDNFSNFVYDFVIGATNDEGTVTNFIDADLDEIGFWNRVLSPTEITALWNSGNGLTYPFGETHNISLSDTSSLSDSISTELIKAGETYNISLSDTSSLSDSISIERKGIFDTEPSAGKNTFYVYNAGQWILFDQVESFSVKKKQNQINEFEVKLFDVTTAQKEYFKEQADVLFFSGTTMILKGRIQTIEYGSAFEVIARGFGSGEAKLLDSQFIKSGDNRVQYTNESAQTIATDINTDLNDNPILTTASSGLFDTDYGNISMRFEHANRLNAIGKLSEAIDYDWWVSQTSSDSYKEDFINIASYRGATSSQKTFETNTNAIRISQERDITSLSNFVRILGYGDGVNQLQTTTYAGSTQSSILNANISSTDNSILLLDASDFDPTGTARIAEEQLTYAGISSNTLTGCTRGINSTARPHLKNCYIEQFFPVTSSQTGSSIKTYGLMDDVLIDKTLMDLETAELIASKRLLERKDPIERITIKPDEPFEDVALLDIGDKITVTDSEANIDGDFRIVGINYINNYGDLDLELEVSNRSLEFIEQMKKQREEEQNLGKYMQGSTNIYQVSLAENCDTNYNLDLRFYIPEDAVAINKLRLNYKVRPYRIYHSSTPSGGGHTTPSGGGHTTPSGGGSTSGSKTPTATSGTSIWSTYTVCYDDHHNMSLCYVYENLVGSPSLYTTRGEVLGANMTGVAATVDLTMELPSGATLSEGNQSVNNNTVRSYTSGQTSASNSSGWFKAYDDNYDCTYGSGILQNVYSHTHGSHNHSTPNHTHTVSDHTHTVSNHSHSVTYGINETASGCSDIAVYIETSDGGGFTDCTTSLESQYGTLSTSGEQNLDLINYSGVTFTPGNWITISIRPTNKCRIEGSAYIQVFIESKGD